jgi:hypothetical protein
MNIAKQSTVHVTVWRHTEKDQRPGQGVTVQLALLNGVCS